MMPSEASYRARVAEQVRSISATLTQVIQGDLSAAARSIIPDGDFRDLCDRINAAIDAARTARGEFEKENLALAERVREEIEGLDRAAEALRAERLRKKEIQRRLGEGMAQVQVVREAMTLFLKKGESRDAGGLLLGAMMRQTSNPVGFLGLVDSRNTLRVLVGEGIAAGTSPVPISESGILRRAFRRGEAILSSDPAADFPRDILLNWIPGCRDFVLVPVQAKGEPLAVALVAGRSGKPSSDDLERLMTPALTLGVMLLSGRDLDRKKAAETRLLQSQKMEAVGRLAGGVAHDFNNLLTTILGHSESLLKKLNGQHALCQDLGEIKSAGEQAAWLTRQLLTFSRREPVRPKVLDLNDVVRDLGPVLRPLIGDDVALRTVLSSSPGTVRSDRGQILRLLTDLAVNARDSMPDGGSLTIQTSNVHLDSAFVEENPSAVEGPYVLLQIADTGAGIGPEALAHVFEPFFTTKDLGKGKGLGLATVHGIVKQSGGFAVVESAPGKGTTFQVYLPRVEGAPKQSKGSDVAPASRGGGTVLLVEDDPMVRRLVRETLKLNGYKVIEAGSGEEALSIFEKEKPAIDLLLTDLTMPGIGGRDVAQALLSRRAGLPVLYMSGYSEDMVFREGAQEPGTGFLSKPFSTGDLVSKVRSMLQTRT